MNLKENKDQQVNGNYDLPCDKDQTDSVNLLNSKDETDKDKEKFFSDLMMLF